MKLFRSVVPVVFSLLLASLVFAAQRYEIEKSHSSIGWSVKHLVITSTKGQFRNFNGTILYNSDDISRSSVQVTIQTASVDSDDEKRDNHLRSADFFDVAKYPEITFTSKKVMKKGSAYAAVGDLTIRGVTKEVTIPFELTGPITDPWGNARIGVEAELTINRQDYGVSWSKTMDNGGLVVGDDVKISLVVEGVASGGTN
jgi:polyisoprenoid-binding protein YceI